MATPPVRHAKVVCSDAPYVAWYTTVVLVCIALVSTVSLATWTGIPRVEWKTVAQMAVIAAAILLCCSKNVGAQVRSAGGGCTPTGCANQTVDVIGGGWSFFLRKRVASAGSYYACRDGLPQRVEGQHSVIFPAGWTIAEVQAYFRKQAKERGDSVEDASIPLWLRRILPWKRYRLRTAVFKMTTMFSFPSVWHGTLGGWVYTASHGSGGTEWTKAIGNVYVRTKGNSQSNPCYVNKSTFKFNQSRREVDQNMAKYEITHVEVYPTDDVLCTQTAYLIKETSQCTRDLRNHVTDFVKGPNHLRMIVVGKRGALFLLWRKTEQEGLAACDAHLYSAHANPHFASSLCRWLQADVCAIFSRVCGITRLLGWESGMVSIKNWRAEARLSVENEFTPPPSWGPSLLVLLTMRNFEPSIYLESRTFADLGRNGVAIQLLERLLPKLQSAAALTWGRCEVRLGGDRLSLDVAMLSCFSPQPYFNLIADVLCGLGCDNSTIGETVFFHRGKYVFEEENKYWDVAFTRQSCDCPLLPLPLDF